MPFIWGWATWKRTWKKYLKTNVLSDTEISSMIIKSRYKRRRVASWFETMIRDAFAGKIDTWDAQLVYVICQNNGLVISPFRNQISNIGYLGTHPSQNKKDYFVGLPTNNFDLQNIIHPLLPPTTNWDVDNFTGKMLEKYGLGGVRGAIIFFVPKFLKKKLKKLLR